MFFHGTARTLDVGNVIHPGAWGGPIQQASWQHNQAHVEAHLENLRSIFAPQAPSRLNCVYMSTSPNDALSFQAQRASDILYQVQPVSPWMFISDMALSRPLAPFRPDWPNRYWASGFIIEIGQDANDGEQIDVPIIGRLREASRDVREELIKLLPCELRSAYHAVSPDLAHVLGAAAARPVSLWAAPEVLTAAPVLVTGIQQEV